MASLEDRGRRLWPARAEGGALLCAETKEGEEPSFGPGLKLKEVKFHLPLGAASEGPESLLRGGLLAAHLSFAAETKLIPEQKRKAALDGLAQRKARGSDSRQVLKLFDSLSKMNEQEQAFEVARSYTKVLGIEGQQELQLLAEAARLALGAGRLTLETRVADLRGKLVDRERAAVLEGIGVQLETKNTNESDDEDDEEDDDGDEEEDAEQGEEQAVPQGTRRPLDEAAPVPPAQRLRVC